MGYQEYVCKVDNINKFRKNRKAIDRFIDNECSESVSYSLVEFKEDLKNIKKGIYVYSSGDRYINIKFLDYVLSQIGGSSYVEPIESAIESYMGEDTVEDEKLTTLFKDKSTSFARVIYNKECNPEKELKYDKS